MATLNINDGVFDPDRPIVDPHHHLWSGGDRWGDYQLEHFWADTGDGHRVLKSVYVECGTAYLKGVDKRLRSLGESEFVAKVAEQSRNRPEATTIAGLVGCVDLRLPDLEDLLDQHVEISTGLLRGIRNSGALDTSGAELHIPWRAPPGLYQDADFRRGLKILAARGLSFDAWHFHHQCDEFLDLVRAVPDLVFVLDHFSTPLGIGPYRDQRFEVFERWKLDMKVLAECPNVYAKLGGLAMPDNGFGWETREQNASTDEFIDAQAPYYHHMIECFGPSRCMFESNFPVDRLSISYGSLWNAFKKMSQVYSEAEKQALFSKTATDVYSLE